MMSATALRTVPTRLNRTASSLRQAYFLEQTMTCLGGVAGGFLGLFTLMGPGMR